MLDTSEQTLNPVPETPVRALGFPAVPFNYDEEEELTPERRTPGSGMSAGDGAGRARTERSRETHRVTFPAGAQIPPGAEPTRRSQTSAARAPSIQHTARTLDRTSAARTAQTGEREASAF